MADLSDVENAIVAEVTGALYPQGLSDVSIVGTTCRVYRGWPVTAALNSDLAAGIVNVAIFPANKPDDVPEPYFDRLYTTTSASSIVASVTGQSVAFSGVVVASQVIGLLVDGVPYTYSTITGDTSESIASNLAALVGANRIAAVSGSKVTVPDAIYLTARVVTNAIMSEGLRRQRREIQVSCWCPSAALRDTVCATVDFAMASSPFIDLVDQTKAHVRYVSTEVYDLSQNALLYRRDLCYQCEYTMISSTPASVMLFGDLIENGGSTFV